MCLYFKRDGHEIKKVGVYVDDILVTATTVEGVDLIYTAIKSLSIKNLEPVPKLLGIRVKALDTCAYVLDQEEAINELLWEHGLVLVNSSCTSISDEC